VVRAGGDPLLLSLSISWPAVASSSRWISCETWVWVIAGSRCVASSAGCVTGVAARAATSADIHARFQNDVTACR
jgi:hypothetical protein